MRPPRTRISLALALATSAAFSCAAPVDTMGGGAGGGAAGGPAGGGGGAVAGGWTLVDLDADPVRYEQISALHCASPTLCAAGTRASSGDGLVFAFDPTHPEAGPTPLVDDDAALDALVSGSCLVTWRFTGFSVLATGGLVAYTNVRSLVAVADDAADFADPARWRAVATDVPDSECNPGFRMQITPAGESVFYASRNRSPGVAPTAGDPASRVEGAPWDANTWGPQQIPPVPAATSELRMADADACASAVILPNSTLRNGEELVYVSDDLSVELMLADGPNQDTGDGTDAPGVCRWDEVAGIFRHLPIPLELLPENAQLEEAGDESAGPVGLRCQRAASGTECLVYSSREFSGGWVYALRLELGETGEATWTASTLPSATVRSLRTSHVSGDVWLLGGKSDEGALLWLSTDGGRTFEDASAGLSDVLPGAADQIESIAVAGTAVVVGLDEDAALAVHSTLSAP